MLLCSPHPIVASLTDYSLSGIGMVADTALCVGERFILQPKNSSISLLVYCVQNCVGAGPGRFRIGSQLVCSNVATVELDQLEKAILSL